MIETYPRYRDGAEHTLKCSILRPYGAMDSTGGFEPLDPGSIPGTG
jgi:hypothetical protein